MRCRNTSMYSRCHIHPSCVHSCIASTSQLQQQQQQQFVQCTQSVDTEMLETDSRQVRLQNILIKFIYQGLKFNARAAKKTMSACPAQA